MATEERYGESRLPIVDPLIIRDELLDHLGRLFTLDASTGNWGGGVEPIEVNVRTEIRTDNSESPAIAASKKNKYNPQREKFLAIGGLATFGTETPPRRGVGVISRTGPIGAYFAICEWPANYDVTAWTKLDEEHGYEPPMTWPHILPERGVDIPEIFDLDLYALGLIRLTRFSPEYTGRLKHLFEPPV